jgi:hypothetical protein
VFSFPNIFYKVIKMKIFVCCLLLTVSGILLAQSKEEKLLQLKIRTDIKVTEIEKDILKLEYPNGKVLFKNIGDYQYPESGIRYQVSTTFDSTIIDLTTIDTTLYYHKYKFWQEVPIHNWDFDYIRVGDVNKNGKPELYGARKFFQTDYEPVTVYELNDLGVFEPVYQYDSVYLVRNIYDIDRDGKDEVHLTLPPIFGTGNQQRFFSKEQDTSLATQLNFSYMYGTGAQLDDQTLGDFDGDGFTDLLFDRWGSPYFYILEYNHLINNFDSVYRFDVNEPPPNDEGGYSIGDFDLDGKTDIVFSTGRGNVFVIENQGNNQYIHTWQGNVGSNNAYIHTWTNDIDKNGKPEFWVLADAYYNGIGTTRITIFETDGDNIYKAIGRVDLVGVFSFYAGNMQSVDIDNDGIEEVAVCIDGNFLILKFNGSQNHHSYSVHYIKQNELNDEEEWQTYFGATMYNLQNYGKVEVLISMAHTINTQPNIISRGVTKLYSPDSTTSINDDIITPNDIKLYQNYPNPFNPTTIIKFVINKYTDTSIKVFNILGKEIKVLLDKGLTTGEYKIQWDGKDNKGNLLPGGIYFIQMKAGENQQTIKSVLLK